jgi:hypothetical protein
VFREKDEVEVAIDLERLHFFDPESDNSLLLEAEAEPKKTKR